MKAKFLNKINRCAGDTAIGEMSVPMKSTDLSYFDGSSEIVDSDGVVYHLVKWGTLRYYIERGADTDRVIGYNGRYGQGFMILTCNKNSSMYSHLAYYVREK